MSVDTKGIVRKGITALNIADAIKSFYKNSPIIEPSGFDTNYNIVCFEHNGDYRRLSVFENYDDFEDITEKCTLLSFGMWGDSVKIMRSIVGVFGGMIMENDCSDLWEPVAKDNETRLDSWVIDKELRDKLSIAGFNIQETIRFHRFIKDNAKYLQRLAEMV